MSDNSRQKLVVWRVIDGKAGHEAQSAGLVDALGRRVAVAAQDIQPLSGCAALWSLCCGRFSPGEGLPRPDLVLGAGHRTHLTVLAAKRATGARAVVLMRPSLPAGCFDRCLVPEHDQPPAHERIIPTTGVLNSVRPALGASPNRGLFLIGGPSGHHDWDRDALMQQVAAIVESQSAVDWTLTTSRRTPVDTTAALSGLRFSNLRVVPFEETERGWVAARLQECAQVWVSEDSVSMVFEALTAGAAVGLLPVPPKPGDSRVRRSIKGLVASGQVVRFSEDVGDFELRAPAQPLAEADRCAALLLDAFALQPQ